MLLLLLILFGVLSVLALLIILWDYFKHGGAAVWDTEHPGRIITMKDAKKIIKIRIEQRYGYY